MLMDKIQGKVETGLLTPLFEARLQYQSDMGEWCRLKPKRVNWLEVAMGAFREICSVGKRAFRCTPATVPMSLCEPVFSRHPGNISAPFIRLSSSPGTTGLKYGLTPKAMGCEELTRATHRCGWSRWRCNLRQRTGGTSG